MTTTAPPTILITGGTGFAGSHLVEALLASGQTDVHVTTMSGNGGFLASLLPANQIHQLDLTDSTQTTELIQKLQPNHIYHLAAFAGVSSSFEQGQQVIENNLKLQLNVLEAARQHAPQAKILVVGSGMEYDVLSHQSDKINEDHPLGPASPYAVSKVIQDLLGLSYFYSYKLKVLRARPFNHIGERQTTEFAVPSFAQQIVAIERGQQQEIRVGNLSAVRDFTDVKDVVQAYILLMNQGQQGEVYNIGSGVGQTMQVILDRLCSFAKTKVKVVIDQSKVRPLDVPKVIADTTKIAALGWQPSHQLDQTLQRILEEWRNHS